MHADCEQQIADLRARAAGFRWPLTFESAWLDHPLPRMSSTALVASSSKPSVAKRPSAKGSRLQTAGFASNE